ncbi:MAG: hypothetical protein KDD70_07280 [Bdellovibrionales bacterium]|nr:hypothetical protein [Bdellovibrionales bacterium]
MIEKSTMRFVHLVAISVAAVFTILTCLLIGEQLVDLIVNVQPAFDSDEFIHATPAHDIAILLQRGEVNAALHLLQQQVFYPPLHALGLALAILSFGDTTVVARLFSFVTYLFAVLTSGLAVFRFVNATSKRTVSRFSPALVSVLFAATCPIAFLVSSLCMLEALGMLITSMILLCLVQGRLVRVKKFGLGSAVVLGILLTLLALAKHTYPILLFPGLCLASFVGDSRKESWFHRRDGWLLLAFFICGLLWCAWFYSVDSRAMHRFLIGHHARGYVLGFEENTYYLRSLYTDYFLFTLLSWIGMALAAVACIARFSHFAVRAALLSLVLSCVAFGFIAEQGPRHLAALAPCLWFLIGVGWGSLPRKLSSVRGFLSTGHAVLSMSVCIATFYATEPIRSEAKRFLEFKPDQDEGLKAIAGLLPSNESYLLYGDETFAFPYHLTWLTALNSGLTVPEARTLRRKIPSEFEGEARSLRLSDSNEVRNFFKRLLKERPAENVLVVKRKGGRKPELYDGVVKVFCARARSCIREETTQYLIVSLQPKDLFVGEGHDHEGGE